MNKFTPEEWTTPSDQTSSSLPRRARTLATVGSIGLGLSLLAPITELIGWLAGITGL